MHRYLYNSRLVSQFNLPVESAVRVLNLKSQLMGSGLWEKVLDFFPLTGYTREHHSTNIKRPGNPLVFNSLAESFYSLDGLQGDGSLAAEFDYNAPPGSLCMGLWTSNVPSLAKDLFTPVDQTGFHARFVDNNSYIDNISAATERVVQTLPPFNHIISSRGPTAGARFLTDGQLSPLVGPLTGSTGQIGGKMNFINGHTSRYKYMFIAEYLTVEEMQTMYTVLRKYAP